MSKLISLQLLVLLLTISCGQSFRTTRVHQVPGRTLMAESGRSDDTIQPELEIGLRLYQQGQFDSAAGFFQQYIFSDPTSWQPYYYLGLIHNQTGRFQSAVEYFYQSLDKTGANNYHRSLIYAGIGDSCRLSGKTGQARLNYHSAININPDCKEARDGLALLNLRSGH